MSNIHWTFVLGGTIIGVNSLVAVADFLQGGVMWPLLIVVVGGQMLAVLGALR